MPTITERLWTVREAAEWLKAHPETVRRWIKAGRLEAVRLTPGSVRIREEELARFAGATGRNPSVIAREEVNPKTVVTDADG
jgi:excisionase family DNA binding protein